MQKNKKFKLIDVQSEGICCKYFFFENFFDFFLDYYLLHCEN